MAMAQCETAIMMMVWVYTVFTEQTFAQINLALHKPAFESSSYGGSNAELATDGDRTAQLSGGSCSHTKGEFAPWWTVDLNGNYSIHSLRIYNRDESVCDYFQRCADRLAGFRVHISNDIRAGVTSTRFKHLCHVDDQTPVPGIIDVSCTSSLVGRYVTISLNRTSTQFLSLCEVEVFGFNVSIDTPVLFPSTTGVTSTSTNQYVEQSATSALVSDSDKSDSTPTSTTSLQHGSSRQQTVFEALSQLHTDSATVKADQAFPTDDITNANSFLPHTDDIEISSPRVPEVTTYHGASTVVRVPEITTSAGGSALGMAHDDSSTGVSAPEMTTYDGAFAGEIVSKIISSPIYTEYSAGTTEIYRSYSATFQKMCCCAFGRKTDISTDSFMSSVLKDLDVDRKNVTKERRRYISVSDERKSSAAIGVSFVTVTFLLCGIILFDFKKVLDDVKGHLPR